jgi:hypothetical protein
MLNPRYLDQTLVENMADHYGLGTLEERQVTRRTLRDRKTEGGFDKGLKATHGRESTEEETEVYSRSVRPVRLVNDVVEGLRREESVIDYVDEADSTLTKGSPILVEGEFQPSPIMETGNLMGSLLPTMLQQAAAGKSQPNVSASDMVAALTGGGQAKRPQLYEVAPDVADAPRFFAVVKPELIVDGYDEDDLTGELTAFGLVDRFVRPGRKLSLDKYLLPGVGRTMRRALMGDVGGNLPAGFATDEKIKPEDVEVEGPVVVIEIAAIFS